jgi:hypothetical protein
MSRREQAPSWSVHNRKESELVGRATDSSAPSFSLSLPPDLVDFLGIFVCLFVLAKVAIVQRNMWNLWLSSFRKISKPNLARETKFEIKIIF